MIEKIKLNLRKTIMWIIRILTAHIGAGGDAHREANEEQAGFLSVRHFEELEASYGNVRVISNTDVLLLSPGRYLGTGMINMPLNDKGENDAGNFIIFVTDEYQKNVPLHKSKGRTKHIIAISAYSGKIYTYNHREAGQGFIPENWRTIPTSKNLYKGSAKVVGTKVNLNDYMYKYDLLEIKLKNLPVQYIQIPAGNENQQISHFVIGGGNTTAYMQYMRLQREGNYTLVINTNVQLGINSEGTSVVKEPLEIIEINGIQK